VARAVRDDRGMRAASADAATHRSVSIPVNGFGEFCVGHFV
jgi:hypothetical protein